MTHHRHHREFDQWPLERKMHGRRPVFENSAARLWNVGNGIACLEFTTETNVLVLESFKSIEHAIRIVSQDFDGLLIGDDDRDFSLGLDMHSILDACERLDWDGINSFIEYGQQVMISLKESPFPVVAVVSGYAMRSEEHTSELQ